MLKARLEKAMVPKINKTVNSYDKSVFRQYGERRTRLTIALYEMGSMKLLKISANA